MESKRRSAVGGCGGKPTSSRGRVSCRWKEPIAGIPIRISAGVGWARKPRPLTIAETAVLQIGLGRSGHRGACVVGAEGGTGRPWVWENGDRDPEVGALIGGRKGKEVLKGKGLALCRGDKIGRSRGERDQGT